MRMRQSIAEYERAFLEHTHLDRAHRHELRHTAVKRTHVRYRERHEQNSFRRFVVLTVTLVTTVVLVSWAMFQTLAWLMA